MPAARPFPLPTRLSPWVAIAAVGLAVLAWISSLQEALALDLPMAIVALAGYHLFGGSKLDGPATGAGAQPRVTLAPAAQVLLVVLMLAMLAGFGYIVWGRFSDSGFVGWLDAVQARSGGRFSVRLSFIAAVAWLVLVFGAAIWAVLKLGTRPAPRLSPSRGA